MTVAELINELKKMPQNAIVASDGRLTWFRTPKVLTEQEIKNRIYLSKDKDYLYIDVEPIDY